METCSKFPFQPIKVNFQSNIVDPIKPECYQGFNLLQNNICDADSIYLLLSKYVIMSGSSLANHGKKRQYIDATKQVQ